MNLGHLGANPNPRKAEVLELDTLAPEAFTRWLQSSYEVSEGKRSLFPPISVDGPIKVLVLCGPRNVGKTTLSSQIAHALGDDAQYMGWIPTELTDGSTSTDISRVSGANSMIAAIGVEGCACCTAADKVSEAINTLIMARPEDRSYTPKKLVVIEISTHSNPGDFAKNITKLGMPVSIVMLQSPHQLETYNDERWLQARTACAVWVTHNEPNNPRYKEDLDNVVGYVRSIPSIWDFQTPVIPSASGDQGLIELLKAADTVWAMQDSAPLFTTSDSKTLLTDSSGFKDTRADAARKKNSIYCNTVKIRLYPGVTFDKALETLGTFKDILGNPVVERVKGQIGGLEVNAGLEDRGLVKSTSHRSTSPTEDYLRIDTISSEFKPKYLIEIAKSIGLITVSNDTVASIRSTYPTLENFRQIVSNASQPGSKDNLIQVYPEDDYLNDLFRLLPHAGDIPHEESLDEFFTNVIELTTEWFRVRADIFQSIVEHSSSQNIHAPDWKLTTGFQACKMLYQPQLIEVWPTDDTALGDQGRRLASYEPFKKLLEGLSSTSSLSINKVQDLTKLDFLVFQYTLEALKNDPKTEWTSLKPLLNAAADRIMTLINSDPTNEKIKSWQDLAPLFRSYT